ncbi:trans-sulfuration enzyme family protein [Albidovulum sp.]|uniref:trans-sulfuration enzyme family protein n=1 Tax=Albidovulum sp. TaxID=1872424 RepID=UPI0039B9760F
MHISDEYLAFETRAIHHGHDPSDYHGSVVPPVFMNVTYSFGDIEAFGNSSGEGVLYARPFNPTTDLLERKLANLERGEACLVTASGMAAIGTTIMGLLSAGDEIIHHRTLYVCTGKLMGELARFGITTIAADLTDPDALAALITPKTRAIYFETPVNPLLEVIDIPAVAERARRAGIRVIVDSTFATPVLCQPLTLGADVVVHSLTKYINGHGDVLAGAVIADAATIEHLRRGAFNHITGATLGPAAAALVMRSLQTLTLRMERHGATALRVAEMLESHPAVAWVKYPFLASHPHHDLARRQMRGGGGVVSFGLHGGFDAARRAMDRLGLICRAVSLGDTHSLMTHPASLSRGDSGRPRAHQVGVLDEMLRLSVGLEGADDILSDLRQALAAE